MVRSLHGGLSNQGGCCAHVQTRLKGVKQIQATRLAFAALLSDETVVTWGHPNFGGDSSRVHEKLQNVQQIHATSAAFAAQLGNGTIVAWGDPNAGGEKDPACLLQLVPSAMGILGRRLSHIISKARADLTELWHY